MHQKEKDKWDKEFWGKQLIPFFDSQEYLVKPTFPKSSDIGKVGLFDYKKCIKFKSTSTNDHPFCLFWFSDVCVHFLTFFLV